MQNYTTIIGVLEMRENNFSYRDCRARYNIGQGTVKLIIDRFQELGLPLSDLKSHGTSKGGAKLLSTGKHPQKGYFSSRLSKSL